MSSLSHQSLRILRLFLEDPRAEVYGADVIRNSHLLSGTVYPILFRFERLGLVTSRWEKGSPQKLGRPRRRLYRITGEGVRVARRALQELALPISLAPATGRA